jgi:hypothetical protein
MAKVQFRVHPKFVYDAMRRQAGTLCKAVLEGVMNAVEAGSEAVHITFKQNGEKANLGISDTGSGILSKKDILRYFATFGQPHTADEQKIWAQFRMGRGQLFSFGINTWRTGTHELIVDIEKWNIDDAGDDWNLDFDWNEGQKRVKGCQISIDLYKNPIGNGYHSEAAFEEAIKKQVEFVAVPVYFNGTLISHDPDELDWDLEDDDAYYLWARGNTLTVYNLGAYCKELDATSAGVTGVVVSKRQLKVNFARNDIQWDCPVWKRIKDVIHANRIRQTRQASKGYLQPHERIATLQDIRDGVQRYDAWKTICLIETSSGRAITLDLIRKNRSPWTFAGRDDEVADKLMQLEQAICLNDELLSKLGYSGDPRKFFTWLMAAQGRSTQNDFKPSEKWFRPFKGTGGLADAFDRSTYLVTQPKWNAAEKRILRVLEKIGGWFNLWQGRNLCMGVSDTYAAWTDGATYIAMDRSWLKRVATGNEESICELFTVLSHEMAHDEETGRTHVHSEEFYRRYHDLTQGRARDRAGRTLVSPLTAINYFRDEMKSARIQEQYDKAQERERKEKELRHRKLGIDRKKTGKIAASTGRQPAKRKKAKPKHPNRTRCRRVRL